MVGAMILSRAVNDEELSRQFLQASTKNVMRLSADGDPKGTTPMPTFSSVDARSPAENRPSETSSVQDET